MARFLKCRMRHLFPRVKESSRKVRLVPSIVKICLEAEKPETNVDNLSCGPLNERKVS